MLLAKWIADEATTGLWRRGRRVIDLGDTAGNFFGKDSLALEQRWHGGDSHPSNVLARSLIVPKEESLVLNDWAAKHKSKLIAAKARLVWIGWRLGGEKIPRIQPSFLKNSKSEP